MDKTKLIMELASFGMDCKLYPDMKEALDKFMRRVMHFTLYEPRIERFMRALERKFREREVRSYFTIPPRELKLAFHIAIQDLPKPIKVSLYNDFETIKLAFNEAAEEAKLTGIVFIDTKGVIEYTASRFMVNGRLDKLESLAASLQAAGESYIMRIHDPQGNDPLEGNGVVSAQIVGEKLFLSTRDYGTELKRMVELAATHGCEIDQIMHAMDGPGMEVVGDNTGRITHTPRIIELLQRSRTFVKRPDNFVGCQIRAKISGNTTPAEVKQLLQSESDVCLIMHKENTYSPEEGPLVGFVLGHDADSSLIDESFLVAEQNLFNEYVHANALANGIPLDSRHTQINAKLLSMFLGLFKTHISVLRLVVSSLPD